MGWCPNSKISKTGYQTNTANFEVYNQSGGEKADRSGGEKAGINLSRMKRIGLLLTSLGGFVSALTLVMEQGSTSSLMVGEGRFYF